MKNIIIIILSSITLSVFLLSGCREQNKPGNNNNNSPYHVKSIDLPKKMSFAGEKVPLGLYYVKESLDREMIVNMYWHSSTFLILKRSNRYLPIIEPILKKNNIPEDFKYIPLIESGLDHVVSPRGASSFWQFMKGTAKDYGLEVNNEVDERYHIERSTEAACKYFQDAYEEFGSWTLAAASYNVGKRGINKQIERQKENNYYKLLLNSETERYIFRILALKEIFNDPEKYGFKINDEHLYKPIPYKIVEVDTTVNSWADFAREYDLTYRLLKEFNPWLRKSYLKNKYNKSYFIKIPYKESIYE